MDVFFLEFSWLRKWKLRAARDKERQMEEKKQQENSNGMNWFFTVKLCSVRHVILFYFMRVTFGKVTSILLSRVMGLWRLPG